MSLGPDLSPDTYPVIGYGLDTGEIGVLELLKNKVKVVWSQIENQSPVSIVKTCKLGKQNQQK